MPVSSVKSQKATIHSLVATAKQHLFKQFPEHEHRLKSLLQSRFNQDFDKVKRPQNNEVSFAPALPQDEVISILEKARQLSVLPGLVFDKETELYLEQQLEDILGFGISSSVNSVRLPFTKGLAQSLPHIYDSPSTTFSSISIIKEAGLSPTRSLFGWQMAQSLTTSQYSVAYPYWIALPLRGFVSSSWPLASVKQWAYKRKMIVINPTNSLFAIVEIVDEYTDLSNKYQLGISPAVSREGLFWSPQNMGRCMIFFVSDSSKVPKPGVYSLL